METGKKDKNDIIIKEDDNIKFTQEHRLSFYNHNGKYKVSYGEGTYDMGEYSYLGWILTNEKGESDGYGWILTEESSKLEIINR